jgi:hypothetical protein
MLFILRSAGYDAVALHFCGRCCLPCSKTNEKRCPTNYNENEEITYSRRLCDFRHVLLRIKVECLRVHRFFPRVSQCTIGARVLCDPRFGHIVEAGQEGIEKT